MPQPALGLVATAIASVLALAFISLFPLPTFLGPVSFLMLCIVPMQVVMVVLWNAALPIGRGFRQPVGGVLLVAVNAVAAAGIATVALRYVGEGVTPPGPVPTHFAIIVVPITFCLAIMFGGWPFTVVLRNRAAAGLALLAASYALTFVIFRTFFNYDFLRGAPVYLASAPHGVFHAVMSLVTIVTALAAMFVVLCFDLWPFTSAPRLMRQPVLGLAWTAVSVAGGALVMWIGVGLLGMDPMAVLTRVTAPFIFGTIIVLNMLQNSLFARLKQPAKGLLNTAVAAAIGVALSWIFGSMAPAISGPMAAGPPGYEYEVWLANALLSVTFPFLIFYAAFFGYWPFAPPPAAREAART